MNLQFLTTISPAKTVVYFHHALTGEMIGMQKMPVAKLPAAFNKPTIIEWKNIKWRVVKATPPNAKDFILDRKLILHVLEHGENGIGFGFDVATICEELPQLTDRSLPNNFVLDISKEDWKQLEFFHPASLENIQEEVVKIETLLYPEGEINTLIGYKEQIKRKQVAQLHGIEMNEFCTLLGSPALGACRFDNAGFIENMIAICTDNLTYYALVIDSKIHELCLHSFECVDEEFYTVASSFDLALADWRNAKIIMV